jgi:hypothetical protein
MRLRPLGMAVLALGVILLPVASRGDHEVSVALKEIEASIRATFDAFNREDIQGFLDGWTDRGYLDKRLFRLVADRPFAKDETPVSLPVRDGEAQGSGSALEDPARRRAAGGA